MGFLYRLEFSSGLCYIGITKGPMKIRLAGHKQSAMKLFSQCLIHKAWRKYGPPKVYVIKEENDFRALLAAEVEAIKKFNTLAPSGYNLTTGGEFPPSMMPEFAAKISASRKGKKHSEETKRNLSLLMTGRASPRKGKKHTEESRAKMSISAKKRTRTELEIARCSVGHALQWARRLNRPFSEIRQK